MAKVELLSLVQYFMGVEAHSRWMGEKVAPFLFMCLPITLYQTHRRAIDAEEHAYGINKLPWVWTSDVWHCKTMHELWYKINGAHARLSKCIYAFLLFVSIVILSLAIGSIINYSLDPICHGDDNFVIGLCVSLIAAIMVLAGCWFLTIRIGFALTSTIALSTVFRRRIVD